MDGAPHFALMSMAEVVGLEELVREHLLEAPDFLKNGGHCIGQLVEPNFSVEMEGSFPDAECRVVCLIT